LRFDRPGDEQRRYVLKMKLEELGFGEEDIEGLVAATGPRNGLDYGFTYSDLIQRLIPAIVLDAYPESAVDPARAIAIAERMEPTAPFRAYERNGN
jgi:hypothetical protein